MSDSREFVWYEKYRPKTIEECVLPERIKQHCLQSIERGEIQSVIFSGAPGIGKTTVARAMCFAAGVQSMVINASKDRGIDMLRTTVTEFASTVSLEGKYKVMILDEADGLSNEAQDALRGISQDFSENCKFILTLNKVDKISDALKSRFPVFEFSIKKDEIKPLLIEFFKVCIRILESENVPYDKAVVADIIQKNFPDFRSILARLQMLSTKGGINLTNYNKLDQSREFDKIIPWIKSKDFDSMMEWVLGEADVDTSTFRTLYDVISPKVDPVSKVNLIQITNRYQVQSTMAIDQAVNMGAYLAELMVEMNFNE